MKHPRIAYLGVPFLLLVAALAAFLLSGALTSRAVQNPSISLDMITTGNSYDEATNTMTAGAIDNCLTSAVANPATHTHATHLIMQNVEDLVAWQVRFNFIGDQMRIQTVNFAPFTDNLTGQNVSFLNLPIEAGVHRDQITATDIPPPAAGPQSALIAAVYNGAQSLAVSPDTPAKAVPDDTSYSAPSGGVLASVTLQVLAGNAGNPSLFMNLDDGSPNPPESKVVIFDGSGVQTIDIPVSQLGDGYHGEGAPCVPLDCVTQECPPVPATPTPTDTPTPTPTPTPILVSPTPTPTPSPAATPPTPPSITTLTVNPTGTFSRDGFRVGLGGTLSCTAGNGAFMSVNAFQFTRGQVLLSAFGSASFTCSGVVQNWAVTAESFAGFFKPGHANVRVRLSTFGPGGFDSEEATARVRLRRGEPPPESPPESPPIIGKIASTHGVIAGTTLLTVVAAGMTLGFVKVLGRNGRRDDIDI